MPTNTKKLNLPLQNLLTSRLFSKTLNTPVLHLVHLKSFHPLLHDVFQNWDLIASHFKKCKATFRSTQTEQNALKHKLKLILLLRNNTIVYQWKGTFRLKWAETGTWSVVFYVVLKSTLVILEQLHSFAL